MVKKTFLYTTGLLLLVSLAVILGGASLAKENPSVSADIQGDINYCDIDGNLKAFGSDVIKVRIQENQGEFKLQEIDIKASATGKATWKTENPYVFTEAGTYAYTVLESIPTVIEGKFIVKEAAYNAVFTVASDMSLTSKITLNGVEVSKIVFNNRETNLNFGYADSSIKSGDAVFEGQAISYVAKGMNYSSAPCDIQFMSNLSTDLDIDYDGFAIKVVDDDGNIVTADIVIDAPSYNHRSIHVTVKNAPVNKKYTVSYTAKVINTDVVVLNYLVENGLTFVINGVSTIVGSANNVQPLYSCNSEKILQPQDEIEFKCETGNAIQPSSTIEFKQINTSGLEIVADSFKFNDKDVSADVKISENGFSYTTPEVYYHTNAVLTYSCKVKERPVSYSFIAESHASIVCNGKEFTIGGSLNSVPGTSEEVQPGSTFVAGAKVPMKIAGSNLTDSAVDIAFKAIRIEGLKIDLDSFDLDYTANEKYHYTKEDFENLDEKNFETKARSLPPNSNFCLTYMCEVEKDANFAEITSSINQGGKKINFDPDKFAISSMDYADNHTEKDILKVNEVVEYKLTTSTNTGNPATVVLGDQATSLNYIDDSFKCVINDEETQISPVINNDGFIIELKDVPDQAIIELKYSCSVTDGESANNDASVKIANFDKVNLGSLNNTIKAQPKPGDNPISSATTGDKNYGLFVLLLLVVSLSITIGLKRKLNER
ncbi:MAG: hypothetical protein Q4E88_01045 [Coriobacteriia bacterium]|nr:hypothetical protein [Coriobacteriia bacterium]